jgi:hypothetical protein
MKKRGKGRPSFKKFTKLEARIVRVVCDYLQRVENFPAPKLKRNTPVWDLVKSDLSPWHAKLRLQNHIEGVFRIDFRDDEEKPRRLCIQYQNTVDDLLCAVLDAVRHRKPQNKNDELRKSKYQEAN